MTPTIPVMTCRQCGVTDRPLLTPGVSRYTLQAVWVGCGASIKTIPRLGWAPGRIETGGRHGES
jgi:hypothetical protein